MIYSPLKTGLDKNPGSTHTAWSVTAWEPATGPGQREAGQESLRLNHFIQYTQPKRPKSLQDCTDKQQDSLRPCYPSASSSIWRWLAGPVFLRCLPLLVTAFSDRWKFGTEIPDSHPFATKAPNHVIPLSPAGPQILFPIERSAPFCPASVPTLQRLRSRSHLFYPLILRKLMAKAFPDSQAVCTALTATFSRQSSGTPSLGEWPSQSPASNALDKTSWEGEGWKAQRLTLTPLLLRDTFTLQHPENWKKGVLGLNKSETLTFRSVGKHLCLVLLELMTLTQDWKQNCWTTDFYRNCAQNNYLSSGLLKNQICPVGRVQAFRLMRRTAAGGSWGRTKAEREPGAQPC